MDSVKIIQKLNWSIGIVKKIIIWPQKCSKKKRTTHVNDKRVNERGYCGANSFNSSRLVVAPENKRASPLEIIRACQREDRKTANFESRFEICPVADDRLGFVKISQFGTELWAYLSVLIKIVSIWMLVMCTHISRFTRWMRPAMNRVKKNPYKNVKWVQKGMLV